MRVSSLADLAPARLRVVVINVGTDLVATRAVLSARAHVDAPVLLVNCDPTDEGTAWADGLAADPMVDVVDLPLRFHGDTLDVVFRGLRDERVLLLDSDAELRDPEHVRGMDRDLDRPGVFGAGFTQGPNRIPDHWSPPAGLVLHMERPWIPCTMLAVAPVQEALDAGRSFLPRFVPNEAGTNRPRLSAFLAARWGPPWAPPSRAFAALPGPLRRRTRTWTLRWLTPLRDRYYFSLRPAMVFYDTGADVFEHLRIERDLVFAGRPVELLDGEVHHYSGVSRVHVVGRSVDDVAPEEIADEVVAHLRDAYGYEWDR